MSRAPAAVAERALGLSWTGDRNLFQQCVKWKWSSYSFAKEHVNISTTMNTVLRRLGLENSLDAREITKAALCPDQDGKYQYQTSLHSLARVLNAMNHAQEIYRYQFMPLSLDDIIAHDESCPICLMAYDRKDLKAYDEYDTGHIAMRHNQC